jgi:hypothetical protein
MLPTLECDDASGKKTATAGTAWRDLRDGGRGRPMADAHRPCAGKGVVSGGLEAAWVLSKGGSPQLSMLGTGERRLKRCLAT